MDISIITKVIFEKYSIYGKLTPVIVKKYEFSKQKKNKKIKSLHFLVVKGSNNQKITSLGEKS